MSSKLSQILKIAKKDSISSNKPITTRFPPEPSGYLHIGHLKALLLNSFVSSPNFAQFEFGKKEDIPKGFLEYFLKPRASLEPYIKKSIQILNNNIYNISNVYKDNNKINFVNFSVNIEQLIVTEKIDGNLLLRFDDTNTNKASLNLTNEIITDILNFNIPIKYVSFSSQYFNQFISLTEVLIMNKLAYVDLDDAELIKIKRNDGIESPFRDNNIEDSLKYFKEGKGCVRLVLDMKATNKCFRDPVIMRYNEQPHMRTGEMVKWYPTYDYVCPILDFVEGVDVALRSDEYRDREYLYIKMLEICKPFIEVESRIDRKRLQIGMYSRLNMAHTVLSKRKLGYLIEKGHLSGWDDPRSPTVRGILNRGVTKEALISFIGACLFSTSYNLNEWDKIYSINKTLVEKNAKRLLAIKNNGSFESGLFKEVDSKDIVFIEDILLPWNPLLVPTLDKNPDNTRVLMIRGKVLLNKEDFNDYKKEQKINLIGIKNFDASNDFKILKESKDVNFRKSLKVNWVPLENQVKIIIKRYSQLLLSKKIENDDNIDNIIDKNSFIVEEWIGENNFKYLNKGDLIQIMRFGNYVVSKNLIEDESNQYMELIYIPDGKLKK